MVPAGLKISQFILWRLKTLGVCGWPAPQKVLHFFLWGPVLATSSLSLFLSFTLILLPLCISVGMAGQVSGVQACLQCSAPLLAEFGEAREACVCLLSVLECVGSVAYTYQESVVDRHTHTHNTDTHTYTRTHTHALISGWVVVSNIAGFYEELKIWEGISQCWKFGIFLPTPPPPPPSAIVFILCKGKTSFFPPKYHWRIEKNFVDA